MMAYVTNGKDVMHIPPDSTKLVKLLPDPKWEKRYGKFPVAFELPAPQKPSYPFSNHEAPATFKPWKEPMTLGSLFKKDPLLPPDGEPG